MKHEKQRRRRLAQEVAINLDGAIRRALRMIPVFAFERDVQGMALIEAFLQSTAKSRPDGIRIGARSPSEASFLDDVHRTATRFRLATPAPASCPAHMADLYVAGTACSRLLEHYAARYSNRDPGEYLAGQLKPVRTQDLVAEGPALLNHATGRWERTFTLQRVGRVDDPIDQAAAAVLGPALSDLAKA